MCSLRVGSRWRGPTFGVCFVVNALIPLLSYCMFSCWLPTIWSVRRIASRHACPGCMGIWRSMDLDRGFPRMRSLWGRICVFLNQGVCMFIWWSMTLTYTLVGGLGLAGCITSLWPPRILLPRLPRASPPSWFQADVLNSIDLIESWSTVCLSVECPRRGFRSEWPAS